MTTLWAKSGDDAPTVAAHCGDVREAGHAVWQQVEKDLLAFVPTLPTSLPKLRAAAELLHDILKANSSYQTMIAARGRPSDRQPVRHEVLAAAFLAGDGPLAEWLTKLVPDEAERWYLSGGSRD